MTRVTSIARLHTKPVDTITLTFEERFRRRIVMTSDNGLEFLLDLPHATDLGDGDDLLLDDGSHIRVIAASEDIMRATCKNPKHLIRTAWHIGNRHLPCEVHEDHIRLRNDKVIANMLEKLGCSITFISAQFNPEGGAYGHGRTHDHSHGHSHDT